MKKNHINACIALILCTALVTGCKKESQVINTPQDEAAAMNSMNKENENSCRLSYFNWPGYGEWNFHYNDKGLADKWTIDFGGGLTLEETIFYDKDNRLLQSNEVLFGFNYVYHFTYTGKRLTRILRESIEFPDQVQDFLLTYNARGEMIRQDDKISDAHVLMYYDAMGNNTKTDIYFGTVLGYSDNYTFNSPVRNPYLNIPGVEYGFPFYGNGGFSNKRWFTSNLTIIYDNGTPYVINDYDPSKTIIKTGNHNFPRYANYYDRVIEGPVNISFGYSNCGGANDEEGDSQVNNTGSNKTAKYAPPLLLRGSAKSIKEQIQKWRGK